jgi:hypothetical protein
LALSPPRAALPTGKIAAVGQVTPGPQIIPDLSPVAAFDGLSKRTLEIA